MARPLLGVRLVNESEQREWQARVDEALRELSARLKVVEVQHEVTEASLRRHWLDVILELSEERDASTSRAHDLSSLRREAGDRFGQVQSQLDALAARHHELRRLARVALRVALVVRRRLHR